MKYVATVSPLRRNSSPTRALATLVGALSLGLLTPLGVDAAEFRCAAGDAACLLAAVEAANLNNDPDAIFLETGTYTLTTDVGAELGGAPLVIRSPIQIRGAGPTATVIENGLQRRILHVMAEGSLTVTGVTLTGAVGGLGVIHNDGDLVVADSRLFRSSGGLINGGTATILNSWVIECASRPRAAVFNSGTITVDTVTFADNRTSEGTNSLSSSGFLTIRRSTFTRGSFGSTAIRNTGSATIISTSIVGNAGFQGGGGIQNEGQMDIVNSTIADNRSLLNLGGGIFNTGRMTLLGTIVARNSAFGASDLGDDCAGVIYSLGYNLIGTISGCDIILQPTDKTGDPRLSTFVESAVSGKGHLALFRGSPAIDGGSESCASDPILATDQLRKPRTGVCDIGAVEFQDFGRIGVLGTNSVALRQSSTIASGDVVANDASLGRTLMPDGELSVGTYTRTGPDVVLKGDSVRVRNRAEVEGDVWYNDLVNRGSIGGVQQTPLVLPVFDLLPAFLTGIPGTQNVVVQSQSVMTLPPGAYGDIRIRDQGTLVLTGGVYAIRSLEGGSSARLLFAAAGDVRIEARLRMRDSCVIGPENSSLSTGAIVFYVAGADGSGGSNGPGAAVIGPGCWVQATLYVPNGTLRLGRGTVATGAFVAKDVDVGVNAYVSFDSFFKDK